MKEKIIIYCDKAIAFFLYLLIFCLPFAKAAVETFAWISIALWFVKRLLAYYSVKGARLIPVTQLNRALAVFLIINALTVLLSINTGLSFRAFFGKIIKFTVLYFVVIDTLNSKRRFKNIIIVMVLSAALIVADAAVQYFRGRDFLRGFEFERLRASFSSANGFAGWLIIMIPLFLGILTAGKTTGRKLKFCLSLLIIAMLSCLLMTYSRGAWLGIIAGFGLFFYYLIRSLPSRIKILAYLSVILCLVAIYLLSPPIIKERVQSIAAVDINLNRTGLWKESLNIIEDFPVLGSGLNTYSIVAPKYKLSEEGGIYPHNSYLQMAAETGIIGLVSFLWILFVFFRAGLRSINNKKNSIVLGLLVGILAFLIQSFFDTHLYSLQMVVLFWFMMGFTMAAIKLGSDMTK